MGVSCTVGGARATFEERYASEIAEVLDLAFGAEGDWEDDTSLPFGEFAETGWADLQTRARAELGPEDAPNLLAFGAAGCGVYLPTFVRAVDLPLSRGGSLRCASLPGLRRELAELARRWNLPLDEDPLRTLLPEHGDHDHGGLLDAPEVLAFARLVLAANEAVRRDCPLWLRV